jgi:hypothetical protein
MMQDPTAQLGQVYIEEYLHSKGFTWESVCKLPKDDAKKLMTDASTYAALKLAEVYARGHTIEELHGMMESH